MKAFLTALAVFAVVTGFAFFASFRLASRADELYSLAESLPKKVESGGFDPVYSELFTRWTESRGMFRYYIGHVESDLIDDTIDDLEALYHSGDSGYAGERRRLISQLARVAADESFSCDSLF